MTKRRGDRRKTKHTRDQRIFVLDENDGPCELLFSTPHGTFLLVFLYRGEASAGVRIININKKGGRRGEEKKQKTWRLGDIPHDRRATDWNGKLILAYERNWDRNNKKTVQMQKKNREMGLKDVPLVYLRDGRLFLECGQQVLEFLDPSIRFSYMRSHYNDLVVTYANDSKEIYVCIDRRVLFRCDTEARQITRLQKQLPSFQREHQAWLKKALPIFGRDTVGFFDRRDVAFSSRHMIALRDKKRHGHRLSFFQIVKTTDYLEDPKVIHRFSVVVLRDALYECMMFSPNLKTLAILFSNCVVLYDLFEAMIARPLRSFSAAFCSAFPPYIVLHIFELWIGDAQKEYRHGEKISLVLRVFESVRRIRKEKEKSLT